METIQTQLKQMPKPPRKPRASNVTAKEKGIMRRLRREGKSNAQIAEMSNRTVNTVRNAIGPERLARSSKRGPYLTRARKLEVLNAVATRKVIASPKSGFRIAIEEKISQYLAKIEALNSLLADE